MRTGVPSASAGSASAMSSRSSALSSPWSCADDLGERRPLGQVGPVQHRREVQARRPSSGRPRGRCRAPRRGRSPPAGCGSPSDARISRTSWAMYSKKVTTNSALPEYFSRSSLRCVATPTGQVSRWQTRIMMQPDTTSGAVAKPYSSAPSSAPMTTSRPVLSWPSTCTTIRSRSPLSSSVCCVSARPSSHGEPACLRLVSGEAPVPPSWPEMSTTSACALDTPAATVPTPTSATSLTWIRARSLAFFRSWMSWARSSIE